MKAPVLQVLEPGLGLTVQDRGRVGWRRFGVPVSGVMDDHAAGWANRLTGNSPDAPVLELLLQGARLAVLREVWLAVTGADADASVTTWERIRLRSGDVLAFPRSRMGAWIYVAIVGGIAVESILGSASAYPQGRLGARLSAGDLVFRAGPGAAPSASAGISIVPPAERRDYANPPRLRVWPGPEFGRFTGDDRERFFEQTWTISSRSNRVGYRLEGSPLTSRLPQLISEPVRVGTLQVPENGCPIVTMRDGPTVGGYPKFGIVEAADLSWLAQCRPGQPLRFQPGRVQTMKLR